MNSSSDACDVIVLGGGPAGSTAASLIAKAGHHVLLLEKEQFPRYSIGESLLPATVHGICRLLGVKDDIDAAGFTVKRGGTFRWGKREEPWVFNFGNARTTDALDFHYAYQVERSRFDTLLLENARRLGVTIHQRSEAKHLHSEDERITGVRWIDESGTERNTRSKYVVDATGHRGPFHRLVGTRVFSKYFQNVALFGYFRGGARMPPPNSGNIFSCAFADGWFWYIPLSPEITSVGAVVDKRYASAIKEQGLEAALSSFIAACPRIRDFLAGAQRVTEGDFGPLRLRTDYSYCNDRFWRPGLVLVGDSACFVDPVFSSGVHLATYSAMLAARSVNSALLDPQAEPKWFDAFESRYRREYRAFYDFLVAFYEMGCSEDSYFWRAREVLKAEESANEAFVRLVAGAGTTMDEFLGIRSGLGEYLQNAVAVDAENGGTAEEREHAAAQLEALVETSSGKKQEVLDSIEVSRWSAETSTVEELERPAMDGVRAGPGGLTWVSGS